MEDLQSQRIDPDRFDALLVDLDGVVTKTADVHAAAWKRLFDEVLRRRAARSAQDFRPFTEADYRSYVDGRPRYEGVRSFLAARGITLPYGSPEDDPGEETICGLGNRKNGYFLRHMEENGVEVFEATVDFIRRARARGMRAALVTSSENGAAVLEAAGLPDLFDVRVDGTDIVRLGLAGKPAPDTFLEAARRLGVAPERSVVVEDAVSGVQAGRAGGFGLVVGVGAGDGAGELLRNGADLVVRDLGEMRLGGGSGGAAGAEPVPLALEARTEIFDRMRGKRPAVFLDYDGTLTPIVDRPDLAVLSEAMRGTIRRLAAACTVAIVSGRDRADVQNLVGIDALFYAGSHGFDIAGPGGRSMQHAEAQRFAPVLRRATEELRRRVGSIPGSLVEEKRFAIAVHYRLVAEEDVKEIERAVAEVAARHDELRRTGGKKVFELRPRLDWHKGKAVAWLRDALGVAGPAVLPFYFGDDETDEDAFETLREDGIGVLVAAAAQPTRARYRLRDTEEVRRFLDDLAAAAETAGG
jgi:alpha,alpha-trehalase